MPDLSPALLLHHALSQPDRRLMRCLLAATAQNMKKIALALTKMARPLASKPRSRFANTLPLRT
jgi:hypothetical protein